MDILTVIILLLLSGFFSGSESALFSIRWWRVNHLRSGKIRNGKRLADILDHPGSLLMTVLLGNTVVNVASSAIFEHWLEQHYPEHALFIAIAVMSVVVLIFCEITPKTIAILKPEKFGLMVARPIQFLMIAMLPFRYVADKLSVSLTDKLRPRSNEPITTDFAALVNEGRKTEVLTDMEHNVMKRILKMGDIQVMDVMVPRTEIMALPESVSFEHAVEAVVQSNYKRIPLYRHSLDNITGILYAKDLLGGKVNPVLKRAPKAIARPPVFVPGHITLKHLSSEFANRKRHMAIVLDEYGGTAGMVTHDDLLKTIFGISGDDSGDIFVMEKHPNGEICVDARIDLSELSELTFVDLSHTPFRTLNGFLLDSFGRIPDAGESMLLTRTPEDSTVLWEIIVEKSAANRIQTVRLRPVSSPQNNRDQNNRKKLQDQRILNDNE
jgi:putative hemolysin